LIKLFQIWSERPRFYTLFILKSQESKCILDYLFDLVNNEKCSSKVIEQIMNMLFNFVTYSDFNEDEYMEDDEIYDEKVQALPIKLDIDLDYDKTINGDLNYGTIILRPYSSSIINHIERIVTDNMSKKHLPAKPLKILARLSSFALNSKQQCEKIISIFIPYLIKNRKQSEVSFKNYSILTGLLIFRKFKGK
jgi:hypothetical protein